MSKRGATRLPLRSYSVIFGVESSIDGNFVILAASRIYFLARLETLAYLINHVDSDVIHT
jgi:hypothetical protein